MEDLISLVNKNREKFNQAEKFIKTVQPFVDEEKNIEASEKISTTLSSLNDYMEKENGFKIKIDDVEKTLKSINQIIDQKQSIETAEYYIKNISLANPIYNNYSNNEITITEIDNEISSLNTLYSELIDEIKDKKLSCGKCNTIGGVKI